MFRTFCRCRQPLLLYCQCSVLALSLAIYILLLSARARCAISVLPENETAGIYVGVKKKVGACSLSKPCISLLKIFTLEK